MSWLIKIYNSIFGNGDIEKYNSLFEDEDFGHRVNPFHTKNNPSVYHTNSMCNAGLAIPERGDLKPCLECIRKNNKIKKS